MKADTIRLEELWRGPFGDAYLERNREGDPARDTFWRALLAEHHVRSVLEVGCNIGLNLAAIARATPVPFREGDLYGIDVNVTAVTTLRRSASALNVLSGLARNLPFRDQWFDLVFTAGVLIHQPETTLPLVMSEIVRCSRRYVLAMEYAAEQTEEVLYRQEAGALFKRPYGRLYQELFPDLTMIGNGFLRKADGWDDVTWWLLERA